MQFYGWWVWAKCRPGHADDLPITVYSICARTGWTLVMIALSLLAGALMKRYNPDDPMPYADGITTALSVVAQYMEALKKFENWIVWIVVAAATKAQSRPVP